MAWLRNLAVAELGEFSVTACFDIGSLDGEQSVKLSECWPDATIVAFEPNPDALQKCHRTAASNPRISILPFAVSEKTGMIDFYQSQTDNLGYSSVFEASGEYDHIEPMPMKRIRVPAIRLDEFIRVFGIPCPEVLWMDCQGSELAALRSLGDSLQSVRVIYTEYLLYGMYNNAPLREELSLFINSAGFRLIYDNHATEYFGDACFVR